MKRSVAAIAFHGGLILILCGTLFAATTWWRMLTHLTRGEEAVRRGDFIAAVAGYEAALHMYLPFHPAMETACRQLWLLGEAGERQGDIARALIAYRSLRSSLYAAHWLRTPGQDWIRRCDAKIAALVPLLRER